MCLKPQNRFFILYINDLPLSSRFLSLLFADDTTLLYTHDDFQILLEIVNTEFKKVCEFFRANRLVLHPDKTKFMIFSRSTVPQDFTILCDNNNVGQDLDGNISQIGRVTIVMMTFLQLNFWESFLIRTSISNITLLILKINYPKHYMPYSL